MIIDIYVHSRADNISKQIKKSEYHKLLATLKQNSKTGKPMLFKFEDGSIVRLCDIQYIDTAPDIPF
ncbi:hypothetical protein CMI47_19205 [Candidatus Pacearchaeota archaeon]|nr:hypothetical protein [Candidatus Pacearchaeota archaeon]|tara:strand:+ start:11349 stop:11549 length:201 start_codon:yes stop_codon:yes gene_type:complete